MKTIAFIDNFIETPVNHCVNDFIQKTGIPCTYHQPSRFGFDSIHLIKNAAGIVVLGSASHVSEKLGWHEQLKVYIEKCIEVNIPVLGICFGHQLIADMFKGKVEYLDDSKVSIEIVRTLTIEQDLWSFKKGEEIKLAYAHAQYVSDVGEEFDIIARTSNLDFEFIKHKTKPLFSLQAHPEASISFIEKAINSSKDQKLLQQIKSDGDRVLRDFATYCLNTPLS